jgi:DNA-binding NarL/FixJ family response regulator
VTRVALVAVAAALKGAWVVKFVGGSFGWARLLTSRLARTPAPPKLQTDTPPEGGCKMKMLTIPILMALSRRQEEILQAACDGVPDKMIADQLGVSPRTLEGHWRAIHRKLGSGNRCQAGFIYAALRENTRGKVLA